MEAETGVLLADFIETCVDELADSDYKLAKYLKSSIKIIKAGADVLKGEDNSAIDKLKSELKRDLKAERFESIGAFNPCGFKPPKSNSSVNKAFP